MPFLFKLQKKFVFQSSIEEATFHLSSKCVCTTLKKNTTFWEKLAIAR